MRFFSKVSQNYYVITAANYDISDYRDDFEANVVVDDYSPGSAGSWDEQAYPEEYTLCCDGFKFDTKTLEGNDSEEDIEGIFKKIKVGDTLTVKLSGKADIPLKYMKRSRKKWDPEHDYPDELDYHFKTLTVAGVKWEGSVIHITTKDSYTEHGVTPSQSRQGQRF